MTFEQWLEQVDDHLIEQCGISSADLPDYCYHDLYEDCLDPQDAAEEAFEEIFE